MKRFNAAFRSQDWKALRQASIVFNSVSDAETVRRALNVVIQIGKFQKRGRKVILQGSDGAKTELVIC